MLNRLIPKICFALKLKLAGQTSLLRTRLQAIVYKASCIISCVRWMHGSPQSKKQSAHSSSEWLTQCGHAACEGVIRPRTSWAPCVDISSSAGVQRHRKVCRAHNARIHRPRMQPSPHASLAGACHGCHRPPHASSEGAARNLMAKERAASPLACPPGKRSSPRTGSRTRHARA